MIARILGQTPLYVWFLLAFLLWLGYLQSRPRRVSLLRLFILPCAMVVLSLAGALSSFGASWQLFVVWAAAAGGCATLVAARGNTGSARFDPVSRTLALPGSWVPMVLILSIFVFRYAVGATLAIDPALAVDPRLAIGASSIYGAMSGVFAGRAVGVWRVGRRTGSRPSILFEETHSV